MKKILILVLICLVFAPVFVLAADNPCSKNTTDQAITALPKCINQIYTWSLGAAALLALLMIILGGYYVMTAQGNGEQASKGKEFIYSAVIGLVLLFVAYLLLQTINPDLVKFNLDSLNSSSSSNSSRQQDQNININQTQ